MDPVLIVPALRVIAEEKVRMYNLLRDSCKSCEALLGSYLRSESSLRASLRGIAAVAADEVISDERHTEADQEVLIAIVSLIKTTGVIQ